MPVKLKGLAWDHRRCWGPLDASVALYGASHGLEIGWDRQSLHDFGEGRLEEALQRYDLVVFDHPFIGDIARDGLLVPFDDALGPDGLARFAADSVGGSWRSYQAFGRQWALPIDAAAQVASYRPDLLAPYGAPPTSHAGLLDLAHRLRADGKWIGLPLKPTDAMCLLMTFAAAGGEEAGAGGTFLPHASVVRIIAALRELAALAHPVSRGWNPIACYEHMVGHDDVVYTPYAFGYVNYATRGREPHLRFADIPMTPPRGALLGGAGIGVSAASANRGAAIDYALFLCAPAYQSGDYVRHGGQPGSLAAWRSAEVNALTRDFFADTLATLQASYLRPTHPGFIGFFRDATVRVADAILDGGDPSALASWLNDAYGRSMPQGLQGEVA